jgi:hypothetical protein
VAASATAVVKISADASGVSSGLAKASGAIEQSGTRMQKAIGGASNAFSKLGGLVGGEVGDALNTVSNSLSNIGEHAGKMSTKLQGLGAAALGVGGILMTMGSSDAAAQQQLAQAISITGHSVDQYQGAIDKTVHAQERFGHGAVDTKTALREMVQATGSTSKALSEMGLVANLAAAKHESLAQAATQVDRILAGKGTRTLSEFGITMAKGHHTTAEMNAKLNELAHKLSGQAAAASDTFSGKVKALRTEITDGAAAFGQKYGPAITAAGMALSTLGTIMEFVQGIRKTETVVTEAQTAAEVGLGAASEATGASMLIAMGPIILIIAAIALAIFLLAKHWHTVWHAIQTVCKAAWDFIDANLIQPFKRGMQDFSNAVSTVWNWLKTNWPLILAILTGPVGLAIYWIKQHWKQVTTFFKHIGADISQAISNVAGLIEAPFQTAIDTIEGWWHNLTSMFSGGVHTKATADMSNYSYHPRALGGPVSPGSTYLVGERGPELLTMGSSGGHITPNSAISGGGGNIQVTVVLDGQVIGNAVRRGMVTAAQRYSLRNGATGLA